MRLWPVAPRVLAVAGDLLVWLPLLAPIALWLIRAASGHTPVLDYLMPAELSPVALLGAGLLLWAALVAHRYRAPVGVGIAVAIGSLVASQAVAVATGLASGRTEPVGWAWALVLTLLGIYYASLAALGVLGIAFVVRLGRQAPPRASSR